MTKYELLISVLDRLCQEAPTTYKTYYPDSEDVNGISVARSRALIHLLLKVYFGLLTFAERDGYVTEGTGDGGVDAYFVDRDKRVIYFIQSKFRQSESNFEGKHVDAEDLLRMDVDRILEGRRESESGVRYNGRIQNMLDVIRDRH